MEEKAQRGSTLLAVKSGVWYVVGTFITKGLAFLTTPIFARLMSPTDYGEFINFANWQSLLLIVISAELYNTLSRAFYDYKEDYDQYASTVTILGFLLSIFFYVFFLINESWIFGIVAIPERYVHLMFIVMMFQGCKQVYQVKVRTLYQYKASAILSVVSLVVPTLISIIIVFLMSESVRLDARIYGFYVPYALVGVYCAFALLHKSFSFRIAYCRYAFGLALPLLIHYLTTYILTSTNVIITKNCLGAEKAAVVSITVSVMNILIMLFQAVSGALTTWMMDKFEVNNVRSVQKGINLFAVCAVVISIGVMLLGPEIILVVGGANYRDAIYLLPGLTFSVFLQILSSVYTIILVYRKKVVGTAITTAIVAVLCVLAKVYFLPLYGIEILPLINILSFSTVLISNHFWIIRTGDANSIQLKYIFRSIILGVFMMLLCPYLYSNNMLRYMLCGLGIFAVIIVSYALKEKIIPIIRKFLKK